MVALLVSCFLVGIQQLVYAITCKFGKHLAGLLLSFLPSFTFIAKYFLKQYPLIRYWWGCDYMHFVNNPPYFIIYRWILIFLIVVGLFCFFRSQNLKTGIAKAICENILVFPTFSQL